MQRSSSPSHLTSILKFEQPNDLPNRNENEVHGKSKYFKMLQGTSNFKLEI